MYYLQSRYYDPIVGRFINADSYASTGQGFLGYNVYAYCNSNPVVYFDPSGNKYVMRTELGGTLAPETPSPEETALDRMRETGLTIYKDAPLTLASNGRSAFTFGYIFMGAGGDENLLMHEYGHIVQSRKLGISGYTIYIVIPSVIGYGIEAADLMPKDTYFSLPWEYKADEYGGAAHKYQSWAKPLSDAYWLFAQIMTGLAF